MAEVAEFVSSSYDSIVASFDAAPVPSVTDISPTSFSYGAEYIQFDDGSFLQTFGDGTVLAGGVDGSLTSTTIGGQVGSFAGNSDFVTATDPGSITRSASASNFGPTTQIFDDGSTLTTAADGTISATSAPSYTLETLQFQAGQAFDSLSASVKEAFSPANINKVAKDVGISLVKQTVGQVIGAVAPPALQPYAARAFNQAINAANAAPVTGTIGTPGFAGPPAPSTINSSPSATNAGPSFVQFDDGSSLQTFEDGSTLAIDVDGNPTSTPAPTDNATTRSVSNTGVVTQTFDDGSTLTTFPDGRTASTPAPGIDPQSVTRSLAQAAAAVVKSFTPGTVNDPNLAVPPLSTAAVAAAVIGSIPGGTAAANTLSDTAARAQGLLRQAQQQQTARVQSNTNAATGDWRVRLQLAASSNYLYNAPDCGPLLWPLRDTNGVIFPYTPAIDTTYKANYSTYDLTHSNYRGYFYQNSYVDAIGIKATFTAQDTAEANYLLACIHFFRSVTKMFYGQDAERGTPPPLVFLSGLGDFQFNQHPCLVASFSYNLPSDVNYIRAQSTLSNGGNQLAARTRQTTLGNPIASTIQRLASLGQAIQPGAVTAPFAPQGSLAAGNPTYVPTKMEISLSLLPVQTRSQVSQQFSVKGFANGNLLKGGFW